MTSIFKFKSFVVGVLEQIQDTQIRIEKKLEPFQDATGRKKSMDYLISQVACLRQELQNAVKTIDKRNSDLVGLLTKYFELEKMKAEKAVAEQDANKPTEDDKRF
jgi:hypothetical protein